MLIQWTKWKATAQDKPQMQVWELPERRLQNPALNIGPGALKPITGGPSPRERQMNPLQSSPGPIKAERWLTQNPPMDLVPWIRVVQLPLPTRSPPPSQTDFSKHLPSASSEQIREHAAQPSPLFLHTNPPHDLVSPRSALRHGKASTEPTANCRDRNPKSRLKSISKRRRGWVRGWGGEEGRK